MSKTSLTKTPAVSKPAKPICNQPTATKDVDLILRRVDVEIRVLKMAASHFIEVARLFKDTPRTSSSLDVNLPALLESIEFQIDTWVEDIDTRLIEAKADDLIAERRAK